MSFWSSLVTWASAPFVVALGVAVTFALLQMSGLLGLLAGEADGDGDGDGEDADGDADDSDDGGVRVIFASLGVGRVPTSLLWQTFAAAFGCAGLAANAIYVARAGALPAFTLVGTIPLAFIIGFVVTRGVSKPLERIMSTEALEATSRADLVGREGVVISSRVSADFGEVRIQDRSGHVVRVVVRSRDGEIAEGASIVVVDCDEHEGRLYVAPLDPSP